MPFHRRRLLWMAAGLLGLCVAAIGLAMYWSDFGPGLDSEVQRLVSLVRLRAGMAAAEIGAGKGRMAVRVARRLGPAGRLYATEIDAANLDAIREAAASAGLANITVLRGAADSARLPEACCDVIYMRRVYHHFTDAASMNRSLWAALRPGGRLAVIDFLSPRWLFFLHHGVAASTVAAQLTAAGFTLERRVGDWPGIGYCVLFVKATAVTASIPSDPREARSPPGRRW